MSGVAGVAGVAVIDLVWDLRGTDVTVVDRATVVAALADAAAVRRWLDGFEVGCARRLGVLAEADPTMFPERDIATATRSGLRSGERSSARATTAGAVPELGAALTDGDVSGEHVDVITAALRDLTPAQRRLLAGHGQLLTQWATDLAPDEFRRRIAKLVRTIQADDGVAKLKRQQAAVRLRSWIDKATGMLRLVGEFDPDTGARLIKRIEAQAEALFHAKTPDLCPDDPIARQQFLQAHALLDLTGGNPSGGCTSDGTDTASSVRWKVEMAITIDAATLIHGWHAGSRVDCGVEGLDLPLDTIRRMALFADIIPVLLDENGVVLKMGRTCRLATKKQRIALRAMYRTCAVPGCRRPVKDCTPHHCDEWLGDLGHTDLDKLLPICKYHHSMIHANGWTLHLAPDRSLTIRGRDGGVIMSTGPPAEQWQ